MSWVTICAAEALLFAAAPATFAWQPGDNGMLPGLVDAGNPLQTAPEETAEIACLFEAERMRDRPRRLARAAKYSSNEENSSLSPAALLMDSCRSKPSTMAAEFSLADPKRVPFSAAVRTEEAVAAGNAILATLAEASNQLDLHDRDG
eukprot:gb/GFBE01073956.1/.p1 GENE.gb/GFBE01073956.1/~~gb/GFBE01073956.1/.p1  ORF type:complete len:148 (+),score=25.57 gb/GFBE01073956.1/:1-444(+)